MLYTVIHILLFIIGTIYKSLIYVSNKCQYIMTVRKKNKVISVNGIDCILYYLFYLHVSQELPSEVRR